MVLALLPAFLGLPSSTANSAVAAKSTRIAFERSVRSGPSEIFVMNADGTQQRRLTHGCCLDWSPDGSEIAYLASDGIYVIHADGSNRRRLPDRAGPSNNLRDECLGGPVSSVWCEELGIDWSPDGRRIAFDGKSGIVVANADGSGASRLTQGQDSLPRWSPDGRRIVFERYGNDIYSVGSDGRRLRRLTFTHDTSVGDSSWSPNGRLIPYGSNNGIFVMNGDGTNKRNITSGSVGGRDSPTMVARRKGDRFRDCRDVQLHLQNRGRRDRLPEPD
jgi:TolB protein